MGSVSFKSSCVWAMCWLFVYICVLGLIFVMFGVNGCNFVFAWDFGSFSIFPMTISVVVDWMSVVFALTVSIISFWVCCFCMFYMSGASEGPRFMGLLMAFVVGMNVLIFVPTVLGMMVGWDWLGIVSFLLVVFYKNSESLSAGMLTVLMNRFGDVCLILFLGITGSVHSWGFWDFDWGMVGLMSCLLLVLASMTKSAQIPFSSWLPAAMAAPTPVSTLVHSSTLVTAGVYLMVRYYEVVQGFLAVFIGVSSLMTLVMAGVGASVEKDLKKVVALSTLSQLGMMMLSLSLGAVNVCFFHLIAHAYFKALMFLCVGSIIYVNCGLQDYRFMGGLWYKMPVVCSWLLVCNACLVGLPFAAGFFSKDLIIEKCVSDGVGMVVVLGCFLSVGLTSFYSSRMVSVLCWKKSYSALEKINDWDYFVFIPVSGMGISTLVSGYFFQSVFPDFVECCFVPGFWKSILIGLMILGLGAGFLQSPTDESVVDKQRASRGWVRFFFNSMWFLKGMFGSAFSAFFLSVFMRLFRCLEGFFEKFWNSGWWDYTLKKISNSSRLLQSKCFSYGFFLALMFVLMAFLYGV